MSPPLNLHEIPIGKDPQEPEAESDPGTYDALLGDGMDNWFLECGCELTRSYQDNGVFLIWCPLHRHAVETLETLNLLVSFLNRDKDPDYFICQEAESLLEAARVALEKAGGGDE